jgi:hypothetical protein
MVLRTQGKANLLQGEVFVREVDHERRRAERRREVDTSNGCVHLDQLPCFAYEGTQRGQGQKPEPGMRPV